MFFVRSKGSLLYNIVYVVAAIALGIFIINHPEALISTVIRIVGICSLIVGVYTLLRYFLRGKALGETPLNILIGGVMTVAGLIFLFYPLKLTAIVFIIIGAVILSKGICELRVAWEARKVGFIGWNGMMISAVITTLLGVLMIINPLFAPSIIFYVMGGALIFEGIATAVAYFVSRDYNDVSSN
ncbi:MAG: DUF308 domain-containing protein [Firmicutes bacterium]|nr:DUF308 domain-containing protein [Bacillota bacterium]